MAYTYLITGATSDVGAALIRHLLTEAPGEDRTILAQGCGDLARLDALVQQFPGRIVTFDADLSSPVRPFWQRFALPHPFCTPAGPAGGERQVQSV